MGASWSDWTIQSTNLESRTQAFPFSQSTLRVTQPETDRPNPPRPQRVVYLTPCECHDGDRGSASD
eukprot:9395632-Prorocentrum_lima.AAC.1